MVFFKIVWSTLSSGPNKQRKGYKEGNENDESDQNAYKNGNNLKKKGWIKFKGNNFENNFMKAPALLCPDNYKA